MPTHNKAIVIENKWHFYADPRKLNATTFERPHKSNAPQMMYKDNLTTCNNLYECNIVNRDPTHSTDA